MKKIILLIIGILIFTLSCNSKKEENSKTATAIKSVQESTDSGFQVFDFNKLKSILLKNPDKIVLLNFWATWCGGCREEIPDLIQFYDEYKGKVVLIGLSLDESTDDIKNFIKLAKINFPVYIADRKLVQHFMVQTIPVTFIFKNGKFINMHIGPYFYADLKRDIDTLQKKKIQ